MRLPARLQAVAACVPPCGVVADVGSHGGILGTALLRAERCRKVIAVDTAQAALDEARERMSREGVADRVELRRGDGLTVVEPGEADVIVVAGLGGTKIARILEEGRRAAGQARRLVLQPMRDAPLLRRWLFGHGFLVEDELLAEQAGRIYEIIVAAPGVQETPDELALLAGPRLLEKRDPLLPRFLLGMASRLRANAQAARAGKRKSHGAGAERVALLASRLEELAASVGTHEGGG